jgi:hypothetical protein
MQPFPDMDRTKNQVACGGEETEKKGNELGQWLLALHVCFSLANVRSEAVETTITVA